MNHPILSLEYNAMERWRQGDPYGFIELSAGDITYVDPFLTQPIRGLDAYKALMEPAKGQIHYEGSEFTDPQVVELGDAAVLTYNYRSTDEPLDVAGPEAGVRWNVTEVYSKNSGAWQIVHGHYSYLRHTTPPKLTVPVPVRIKPAPLTGLLGELLALESGAMERWRQGDPWGFIELSASGVTYFDTGTPRRINGRDALAAEYKLREGKIHYDVMDFVDPSVQVYGNLAVLFYRFLSTWLNPDGSVSHRTPWNCTEVFAKHAEERGAAHEDGEWKIIHTHWSLIGGEQP